MHCGCQGELVGFRDVNPGMPCVYNSATGKLGRSCVLGMLGKCNPRAMPHCCVRHGVRRMADASIKALMQGCIRRIRRSTARRVIQRPKLCPVIEHQAQPHCPTRLWASVVVLVQQGQFSPLPMRRIRPHTLLLRSLHSLARILPMHHTHPTPGQHHQAGGPFSVCLPPEQPLHCCITTLK